MTDLDNWRKIKEALEAAGKTDNQYYRRAVAICSGKPDPFEPKPFNYKG